MSRRRGRPVPLQDLLSRRSGLVRLTEESARRGELLRQVRDCLPASLAASVYSVSLRNGALSLTVASAGWASRLRLAAPELRAKLQERHRQPCERIIVRVRPAPTAPVSPG